MCLAKEANDGAGLLVEARRVSTGLADAIRTMNEANRQRHPLAIGQDNPISHHLHHHHGGSGARSQQLVGNVRWARALNALLFVGYLAALINSIDHEQLGHLWTRTRTLNFQNFQSRALGFKHKPWPQPPSESPPNCWSVRAALLNTMELGVDSAPCPTAPTGAIARAIHYGATSCSPAGTCSSSRESASASASSSSSSTTAEQISGYAAGRATNKPRSGPLESGPRLIAANIRYYLLIVTLVDIIANRDWRRLKRALAAAMQSNKSQLGSGELDATSSLAGMSSEACRGDGSSSSTRTALARLGGFVSTLPLTSPKHLFQITQVALLMVFPLHFESPLGTLISLMSPLNTLNQMVRFALDTYQAHCYLALARNRRELAERELFGRDGPGDSSSNNNNTDNNHVNASANLALSNGVNLNPLGLKRYLLISQIVHLKMTTLALLIHLDLKPCVHSLELLTIIICLVQTLLVMFATFNEFHTFHSRQPTRDDLDEDDKLKVD